MHRVAYNGDSDRTMGWNIIEGGCAWVGIELGDGMYGME